MTAREWAVGLLATIDSEGDSPEVIERVFKQALEQELLALTVERDNVRKMLDDANAREEIQIRALAAAKDEIAGLKSHIRELGEIRGEGN